MADCEIPERTKYWCAIGDAGPSERRQVDGRKRCPFDVEYIHASSAKRCLERELPFRLLPKRESPRTRQELPRPSRVHNTSNSILNTTESTAPASSGHLNATGKLGDSFPTSHCGLPGHSDIGKNSPSSKAHLLPGYAVSPPGSAAYCKSLKYLFCPTIQMVAGHLYED